ncbi:Positive regulator of purine utilization, partial [Tolypocladium ophioglossoides CBS 100239]
CDDNVPSCANCQRLNQTCLVEDPATKRHQPRNYLETLEERVALLEGLLQQARPDVAGSSLTREVINVEHGGRPPPRSPRQSFYPYSILHTGQYGIWNMERTPYGSLFHTYGIHEVTSSISLARGRTRC